MPKSVSQLWTPIIYDMKIYLRKHFKHYRRNIDEALPCQSETGSNGKKKKKKKKKKKRISTLHRAPEQEPQNWIQFSVISEISFFIGG